MIDYKCENLIYSENLDFYELETSKNLFELIQENSKLFEYNYFNDLTKYDPVLLLNKNKNRLNYELYLDQYEAGQLHMMGIRLLNHTEFKAPRYAGQVTSVIGDDLFVIFSEFGSFMKSEYVNDDKLKIKFMDILNDLLG